MNKKMHKKGFTLIEVIIVLAIIAILAAALIPSMYGFVDMAKEDVCNINRLHIVRFYRYAQMREYMNGGAVALSDIVSGDYAMFADDVEDLACPNGGTFTADDDGETISCSIHGDMTGNPGGDPGGDEPGGDVQDTPDWFYLTGDPLLKVSTWGDLETFDPAHDGEPGTIIETGTIFYYKGDYYLFKDNQYITKDTNLATYVASYGVKINNTVFTTPGPSSNPGDLKLVNGKAYVFFPHASRYYQDYYAEALWHEIVPEP